MKETVSDTVGPLFITPGTMFGANETKQNENSFNKSKTNKKFLQKMKSSRNWYGIQHTQAEVMKEAGIIEQLIRIMKNTINIPT